MLETLKGSSSLHESELRLPDSMEQPNKKATLLPCEQRSQQTELLLVSGMGAVEWNPDLEGVS
jgi:hypothetical protein